MANPLLPERAESQTYYEEPAKDIGLENRVYMLEQQVDDLKRQLKHSQQDNFRAMSRLLSPLYKALAPIFGEIVVAEDAAPVVNDRKHKVWESWKQKLPAQAKVIDALLLHGEMNTQQLAIAVGLHRTTIPAHIYKLNQAGLINKSGGRFSLKEL